MQSLLPSVRCFAYISETKERVRSSPDDPYLPITTLFCCDLVFTRRKKDSGQRSSFRRFQKISSVLGHWNVSRFIHMYSFRSIEEFGFSVVGKTDRWYNECYAKPKAKSKRTNCGQNKGHQIHAPLVNLGSYCKLRQLVRESETRTGFLFVVKKDVLRSIH